MYDGFYATCGFGVVNYGYTMSCIEDYFIRPDQTLKDALSLLNKNDGKIVLVVNETRKLLGTVTDGDIRRALLKSGAVDMPVSDVMNTTPLCLSEGEDTATLFSLMQSKRISNVPIVNEQGQVVDLTNMSDIIIPKKRENWVVIMAGGVGSRLRPLTDSTPKPMLPVNGSPVLEILIKAFISQGFYRFYVSVNYLAEQIKNHFGDGQKYGIEIRYLEESHPLGTAGALSLLEHTPKDPFIVINGDIVTNVRFSEMLDFHQDSDASVTMGVREHSVQIPYGVVKLDEQKICDFIEKPTEKYYVNTGMYVLNPDILSYVPEGVALTMPDLIAKAQTDDHEVQAFPVTESWLDIGRMEDFSKAEDLVEKLSFAHTKYM